MNQSWKTAVLLCVFSVFAISAFAESQGETFKPEGATKMTVEELKALADSTAYDVNNVWVSYLGNNNDLKIRIKTKKGMFLDTGTRKVTEDGQSCLSWNKRKNANRCASLWKRGDKIIGVKKDGKINSVFTVKKGNTENL